MIPQHPCCHPSLSPPCTKKHYGSRLYGVNTIFLHSVYTCKHSIPCSEAHAQVLCAAWRAYWSAILLVKCRYCDTVVGGAAGCKLGPAHHFDSTCISLTDWQYTKERCARAFVLTCSQRRPEEGSWAGCESPQPCWQQPQEGPMCHP